MNILIGGAAALFLGILTFIHIKKDSSTAKTISCLTDLFPAYKKVMGKINTALLEAEEL
jgi:hypothetical protein